MAKKSALQIIDNQRLKESKNSLIREFLFSLSYWLSIIYKADFLAFKTDENYLRFEL